MSALPVVRLLQGHDRRLRGGHPWVFANEIGMDAELRAIAPGTVVRLDGPDGATLALAHFNPHSLIAARVLTRDHRRAHIDAAFLARRIERALRIRARLFDDPFYRLVHAEADGLPGLVVDRYDDVLVAQLNTAGMAALEAEVVDALGSVLGPVRVVLRNDGAVRELEGLGSEVRVVGGTVEAPIPMREHGLTFLVDPLEGQKTGWFYDQRDNRAFAARFAGGARVLDLYTYTGGFGLLAAARGAREVVLVDRSEAALSLARSSAAANELGEVCRFERADAFPFLERATEGRERFGLVLADPPAFARSRKDVPVALRGYRKLVRALVPLVEEGGVLAVSSCSHGVAADAFVEAIRLGLRDAARPGRILRIAGAGSDHPVHPALPESAYLEFVVVALD